jgi:hypothetical protein
VQCRHVFSCGNLSGLLPAALMTIKLAEQGGDTKATFLTSHIRKEPKPNTKSLGFDRNAPPWVRGAEISSVSSMSSGKLDDNLFWVVVFLAVSRRFHSSAPSRPDECSGDVSPAMLPEG